MNANGFAYLKNGQPVYVYSPEDVDYDLRQGLVNIYHQKFKLAIRDNFICGICEKPITTFKETSVDHIIPRSKGGTHEFNNKQVVHEKCNYKKGDSFTEKCKQKYIILNSGISPHIELIGKTYNKIKNTKKKDAIPTEKVLSNAPMNLFNEIVLKGLKNLSYDKFVEYFEEYRNAPVIKNNK